MPLNERQAQQLYFQFLERWSATNKTPEENDRIMLHITTLLDTFKYNHEAFEDEMRRLISSLEN